MRKKIKIIRKNLLRFKTSEKKIREKQTAAPILEYVSIDTCHSLISTWNFIQEKKRKEQHFDLRVLASRMVSKLRHFNKFGL